MSGPARGQVITFYSFKGGTGRSMAVANVGCLLARKSSCRVLMIDFDLEAPGLHRYFPDTPYGTLEGGVIELMSVLAHAAGALPRMRDEQRREQRVLEIVQSVALEDYIRKTRFENLDVMFAGRFDEKYGERVATFAWPELYLTAPEIISLLMLRLGENYTHILVDSRTGFNDVSGLCTAVLPEKLVFVFTPNRQNLDGAEKVIREAIAHRRQSNDLRPLIVFPFPSRIENAEPVERDLWRLGDASGFVGYQPHFEEWLRSAYGLPRCDLGPYFDAVQVQHVPFYAYGEKIAAEIERSRDILSLSSAYQRFIDWLEGKPWSALTDEALKKYATALKQRFGSIEVPGTFISAPIHASFVRPQLLFRGAETAQHLSWRLVSRVRHLEIQGEHGSGKTTLLQWLAVTAAEHLDRVPHTGTIPVFVSATVLDTRLPVIESLRAAVGQFGLPDHDLFVLRESLATRLQAGSVAVLVDDIDSLESELQRALFDANLQHFARTFPRCPIVITRRTGPLAALNADFKQCSIGPVTSNEQRHLVRLWSGLSSQMSEGSPGTAELHISTLLASWRRRTPLLVEMALRQIESDESHDEFQLCRSYLDVVLGRTASKTESIGDAATIMKALQTLALVAFSYRGRDSMPITMAEKELRKFSEGSEAHDLASAIRATGIVEWRSRSVAFTSPPLAEYLAASYAAASWPRSSALIQDWLFQRRTRKRIRLFRFMVQAASRHERDEILTAIIEPPENRTLEMAARAVIAARVISVMPDVRGSVASRILGALVAAGRNPHKRTEYEEAVAEIRLSAWGPSFDEILQRETPIQADDGLRSSGLLDAIRVEESGDVERAIRLYTHVMQSLTNTTQDDAVRALALFRRGTAYEDIGNGSAALVDYRLAVEIAQAAGDRVLAARARFRCAQLFQRTNHKDGALAIYRDLGTSVRSRDFSELQEVAANSLVAAAEIEAERGRKDSALLLLDEVTYALEGRNETALAMILAQALLVRSIVFTKARMENAAIAALDEIATRFAGRYDLAEYLSAAQLRKASLLKESDPGEAAMILDRLIQGSVRGRLPMSPALMENAERLRAEIAKRK